MARASMKSLIFLIFLSLLPSALSFVLEGRIPRCNEETCGNCCGNFCCADGADCVGGRCKAPPPPPPQPIKDWGMTIQFQQSVQWCWIAVATSITHFYHPDSTWQQCEVMTDVGHRLNGFDKTTSVCPKAATLSANPALANALANPYGSSALYVLDGVTPAPENQYLKSGYVKDPLDTTGNFASARNSATSRATIGAELSNRRPVAVHITWPGGAQHVVVIAGVSPDLKKVLILDPVSGRTEMKWDDFPSKYSGGATINSYVFTKSLFA